MVNLKRAIRPKYPFVLGACMAASLLALFSALSLSRAIITTPGISTGLRHHFAKQHNVISLPLCSGSGRVVITLNTQTGALRQIYRNSEFKRRQGGYAPDGEARYDRSACQAVFLPLGQLLSSPPDWVLKTRP